jgi:beta-glucosidase
VWGAATSAYQVEGAAREDGRGESVWDRFCAQRGRIADGSSGAVAADHYHRWQHDLDLMQRLGLHSYRFSVAWPRIRPEAGGPPDRRGLDFYKRLADGLRARGIAPMATLFHWDTPQWVQDLGGWENRDTARRFADYAHTVAQALGDRVDTYCTVNEPKTVVQCGYLYGNHAPGIADGARSVAAMHHLLLGHGRSVQALRAARSGLRIGPALNLSPTYPASAHDDAVAAAQYADHNENALYLQPVLRGSYPEDVRHVLNSVGPLDRLIRQGDLAVIASPVDFVGVNCYTPRHVAADGSYVTELPTSQASWEQIHPQGLQDILEQTHRSYPGTPLVITENGVPTTRGPVGGRVADADRISFLRDHLAAARRAIGNGVPLKGYYLWSLLDNFEWHQGYTQRWGMVHVDYTTQVRTPKDSASWCAGVIARNGGSGRMVP